MGNKVARCVPVRQRKSFRSKRKKQQEIEDDKEKKIENSSEPQQNDEVRPEVRPSSLDEESQPKEKLIYSCLYDFTGRNKGDLSFVKGDAIEILHNSDGDWWLGKCLRTNCTGYIPSNYIEPLNSLRSFE